MNKEVVQVLETAKGYMENLNNAISKATEYMQNENYYHGINLVISITDGLDWIIQLIGSRKDIYIKDMNIKDFTNKIKEIVEAFENEDYVLIGDLLEYEVKPIIDEYYDVTNKLLNQCN